LLPLSPRNHEDQAQHSPALQRFCLRPAVPRIAPNFRFPGHFCTPSSDWQNIFRFAKYFASSEFAHQCHHRDKAVPVFECRLCLTAPQAKFIEVYFVCSNTWSGPLREESHTRSEESAQRSNYAGRSYYADAACVFRRAPLSKVSATPSLAFENVACISARNASDTVSDRRSPRATRLTYEGSHPTFCATRL
jgi:hypothetical protein